MNYMVGDFFALLTAFMCAGYNVAWKKVVGDPSQGKLQTNRNMFGGVNDMYKLLNIYFLHFCLRSLFDGFNFCCWSDDILLSVASLLPL